MLKKIYEKIESLFPEMTIVKNDNNLSVTGEYDIGVKGFSMSIDCSETTVKIKCNREYTYPISSRSVDEFQGEMLERNQGYSIYVNGQTLYFSKFFSYQTVDDAILGIENAITVMKDAVLLFEDKCVNFLETHNNVNVENDDYNPEDNINIVNVDNTFHAVSMSDEDSQQFKKEHKSVTKNAFEKLASDMNCIRKGNDIRKILDDGREIRCSLFEEDSEILISVSIPVDKDVGAMYETYVHSNYPEVRASYNFKKGKFIVKQYANPDEYTPDATEESLRFCNAAIDSCINEYKDMLEKKDSASFASDVQQILEEHALSIEEKEREISKKEEELNRYLDAVKEKEKILKEQMDALAQEKNIAKHEIEIERKKIKEKEQQMQDLKNQYEAQNTRDILKIKELAGKVAALQNKQNVLLDDNNTEEEIFRLTSKVSQLTTQRIAVEKKLKETISAKDERIRQLSDVISEKERNIDEIESNIEDAVKSRVQEEEKKTKDYIDNLEKQLSQIGHILTAEDMISFLNEFNDVEIKKFHAPNANFVVYNDGALEIRIRFGDTNYVDVSREASLKDQIIRKLNTKHADIKFFNGKDNKIIARSYFKINATVEEVDELIDTLSSHFTK